MSRGIVVLAQNTEKVNYVDQACLLAMSLKVHNPNTKISLVTNDKVEKENLFDKIIPIPFGDHAEHSDWKVENRWKLYHASPYDKTIVMDTDMLVLQNIDVWWDFLENYEIYFTNKVLTYRGTPSDTKFYRKTFIDSNLPNLFSGLHYFKKCEFAQDFYAWLELVVNNWQTFYEQQLMPQSRPQHVSIDVCASIVAKILDCEDEITNSISSLPTFVHMKSHCQDWKEVENNWLDKVGFYISKNCEIKIGNFIQNGVLHYTEDNFLEKTPVVERYRSLLNV